MIYRGDHGLFDVENDDRFERRCRIAMTTGVELLMPLNQSCILLLNCDLIVGPINLFFQTYKLLISEH